MSVVSLWRRMVNRFAGRAALVHAEEVKALVRKSAAAARDSSAAIDARLRALTEVVEAQRPAKELRELRQSVQALRQSVGGVSTSLTGLAAQLKAHEDPLFAAGRTQLISALEKVASRSEPVLVGPWTGEVGYELLYWIPFLRWVASRFSVAPSRQVIVSRGGTASWYGVPEERYTDVFSLVAGDEFRAATGEEKTLKQHGIGPFHRRIIDEVSRRRGFESKDVLHPSWMFKALRQYWDDHAGYARVSEFTKYELLTPPLADRPTGLPEHYVAVRFYFRRSFADNVENRAFVQAVVSSLAERTPVVVLTSGARVDDHCDWLPSSMANVTVVGTASVERNLAVQSAVIGGARAFVGTYGGYSYLAPLYRVPTIAFYARRRFDWSHLSAAERAFETIGAAPLTAIQLTQAALVQSTLRAITR